MPIYEYVCRICMNRNEILQKEADPNPEFCNFCKSQKTMTKIISNSSFQLKGGGWYSDLYSNQKYPDKKEK